MMKNNQDDFNQWLSYQDMIERITDDLDDILLMELEEELYRDNINLSVLN